MAVGKAFLQVDMSSWGFIDSFSVTINSARTVITETGGGEVAHYFGNFSFSPAGDFIVVTGGTLTGTDRFIDGVRQYDVQGLNASAVEVYDYLLEGTDGVGLLSYLFRSADTLTGSSFADLINGFGGNDKIDGKGGNDNINGGAGNDTLIWGNGDTLNGAAGTDTVRIAAGDVDLTSTANPNSRLVSIEQFDLLSGKHRLTLNKSDVLDMSPTDSVKILGDAKDKVDIVGSFKEGATKSGFTAYALGSGAKLLIDQDIVVV